jgi:hypothetical protein
MLKITSKDKAMIASYIRSMIGSMLAVYSVGATDPRDFAKAALAAVLPPIIRWANPKDPAFGRGREL